MSYSVNERSNLYIRPGIYSDISGQHFPTATSYAGEIDVVLDERTRSVFPFRNQRTTFIDILESLLGPLPYCVLLGHPGIGKTMELDFIYEVLNGDVNLEEIITKDNEVGQLLSQLKKAAAEVKPYDQLLLPDLNNPKVIWARPYIMGTMDQDLRMADEFVKQLTNYFNKLVRQNRHDLRYGFNQSEYREFIRAQINEAYLDLYRRFAKRFNVAALHDLPVILLENDKDKFSVRFDFVSRAQQPDYSNYIIVKDGESQLNNAQVIEFFRNRIDQEFGPLNDKLLI